MKNMKVLLMNTEEAKEHNLLLKQSCIIRELNFCCLYFCAEWIAISSSSLLILKNNNV